MGAIVFTSAGSRKYHFDKGCTAFHSAQLLSDADCGCDTYCTHRMPRMHGLLRLSAAKAAMDWHKLPCLACVPEHLRELPDADHFGHEPEPLYAPGPLGPGDDQLICARCQIGHDIVLWPCTSAVVLGLVAREEVTA